nr:DUF262 domain-containing protein [uncultured Albidiferax sp.]
MPIKAISIRKIVNDINDGTADGGGLWLPNIQRDFVWTEDQICRLFDSILREYPISTLLVWKTHSSIRRRKFIDNWRYKLSLIPFFVPENNDKKCLVLDGQQRLQSLFIGLRGSFDGKELYFNVLSGNISSPEEIKYHFEFKNSSHALFPWIKFKELVFSNQKIRLQITDFAALAGLNFSAEEDDRLYDNLESIARIFCASDAITYQELDTIEYPDLYTEDDVVEVFIRANSGGTKLEKSDLLFSLLNSAWPGADEKMEELLNDLNRYGFNFDRDFVLKTCLVLLDQGAKYRVERFRAQGVREKILNNWESISNAIRSTVDFIRSKTYIQCDKALPSNLALIPLIYVNHHFPGAWRVAIDVEIFLVRTLLAGAFSGQSDTIIDALVKKFKGLEGFDAGEGFLIIQNQNRSLKIPRDRFFEMGYGSRAIHLILNLWYKDFNYRPSYNNNLPEVDHIFPKSILRDLKVKNAETGKTAKQYGDNVVNQLANCMLLTREENGAGQKTNILPVKWFEDKSPDYLNLHLIPNNPDLWGIERFDEFIAARKILITEKFNWLLVD